MEYRVIDIMELILEVGLVPSDIVEVTAAWGEEEGGSWSGGFCFSLEPDLYGKAIRYPTGRVSMDVSNDEITPGFSDYDSDPTDINHWLADGANYEEVLDY